MKLYIPIPILPYRRQTMPLIKPYFNRLGKPKGSNKDLANSPYRFVDNMAEADYVVLPMSWNYYVKENNVAGVADRIHEAATLGKTVLSFQSGDYGVEIPGFSNLIVYRANGHKSRLPANHLGLPPFIGDPLRTSLNGRSWQAAPYSTIPKIGFCGMANPSYRYAFEELKRIALRNLVYYSKRSKTLPQPYIPTTLRRAQILNRLASSNDLETNFIYRKHYQAGARTAEEKQRATTRFYQNIWDNQYVFCFRGAGNFSIRFYETLAMGRIPIFVNTDCLLPLENKIDWKDHVVWVEYADRHKIVERVIDFHKKFDEGSFMELQKRNRQLWEESLTLEGFFNRSLDV